MTFLKFSKIYEILPVYMTLKYCAAGENFEDFIVRNDDFPIENSTISRWNQKKTRLRRPKVISNISTRIPSTKYVLILDEAPPKAAKIF